MTTFDDRTNNFEKKLAHDQELQFRVNARRNKLLGLWAAERMGKSGEQAEAYAKEVVLSDYDEKGDDDVLRKVLQDLQASGLPAESTEIRAKMNALLDEAKHQLMEASR